MRDPGSRDRTLRYLRAVGVDDTSIKALEAGGRATVDLDVLSRLFVRVHNAGVREGAAQAEAMHPYINKRLREIEGYYDERLENVARRNEELTRGLRAALPALEAVKHLRAKAAAFAFLIADVQWWFLGAKAMSGDIGEIPNLTDLRDLRHHLHRLAPQPPTPDQEIPF